MGTVVGVPMDYDDLPTQCCHCAAISLSHPVVMENQQRGKFPG